MDKLKKIHVARMVGMPVAFFVICAMLVLSIKLYGVPSVLSPFLLVSVYFIVDFLTILFSKKDTFKIKYKSLKCGVWQTMYKIFFYIDITLGLVFFIIGILSTIYAVV